MHLSSPYTNLEGMRQYKSSFHNHTMSSGRITVAPRVAASIYRLCGISVVAITDHDRRLAVPGAASNEGKLDWRESDWQHNYDDMLLIHGYEASFPADDVNVLGCLPQDIPHAPGEAGFMAAAHACGAFTILNHPAKWNSAPDHIFADENLANCDGIEIYNGSRSTMGEQRSVATILWDACLTNGLRHKALAGPDCHRYNFNASDNPLNGWNMLWLPELTVGAVFDALRAGRFYASSGIEVADISVADEHIYVRAPQAKRIRFIGTGGVVLDEVCGNEAAYTPQAVGYVRVELEGDKPPFPGADMPQRAWLQPVWVES